MRYEREKQFDGCSDKRLLSFDFYLPDHDVLIEFDGTQHYSRDKCFDLDDFENIVRRDRIKNKWAEENGYYLIRIPYEYLEQISAEFVRQLIEHATSDKTHVFLPIIRDKDDRDSVPLDSL